MAEAGDFSGLRFEAPDPDPAPAPQPATPASGPAAPAEKEPKGNEPDERYEALEREVNELRSSNRQLVDLVGRAVPPKKDAAPAADPLDDVDWGDDPNAKADEEPGPEDPTALVDDLAKLGRDALAKRGFIRESEVRKIVKEESRKAAVTAAKQIVGKTRTQVTTESAILRDFPDLADPESELYKATVPHIQAAVRLDPGAARNPSTLFLAATAAKAALDAKGGGRQRGDRDVDPEDEEEEDREPVRRAAPSRNVRDIRIASQAGDRNRTPSRTERRGDDDFVMDADAKSVAKMMGLTDDEYRTEATRVRKTSSQSRRRA